MRRRILVSIVALTAVAVVVFAVPLAFVLAHLYHEEEVVRLERAAAEAGGHVPASFPHTVDPVELPPDGRSPAIGLYGRDGRRVTGTGPRQADSAVRSALRGEARDTQSRGSLIVAVPFTRDERIIGALRASVPTSAVSNRTRDAILVMIGLGIGAVGLSALIAIYQSRRLARPVMDLARAADRLGDGDFTVRTEPSGIPEIDAVSVALGSTATRLDQMLTRERLFSEDASHQLRTPLTGLRVNLEAARLDQSRDRTVELDAALAEVDRLDRTIDDLLALARESPADRSVLDIAGVLAALEDDWHGRLAADARPLHVVVDRNLAPVTASPRAMRQILDVLLDNAHRHGAGAINVRARSAPVGIAVEVSDEGPGVTGEPERIFERRAPESRGHGIGLALARSLAEAEGARLRLEHAAPGPVFTVFLPATPPSSAP